MTGLSLVLAAAFLLCGCIVKRQTIAITPEPGAPELLGARWADLPVHYCVARDNDAGFESFETLVQSTADAFAQWGLGYVYDGECIGEPSPDNGRNEVHWGQLGGGTTPLNEAGATNLRYRRFPGQTAEIIEADVTVDSDPPRGQQTKDCLQTTLLHEVGHVYGLQHLPPPAIMSAVITDCDQHLTQADRDAMAALYGGAGSR